MSPTPQPNLWQASYERIIPAPLHKVWEITSDFLDLHKWAPTVVGSCYQLEGEPQTPGCLRCAAGPADTTLSATERLLEMDASEYRYKYLVETCTNPQFEGYVSTFKLSDAGNQTTRVVWSYELNAPRSVAGTAHEVEFRALALGFYESCLKDLEKLVLEQKE